MLKKLVKIVLCILLSCTIIMITDNNAIYAKEESIKYNGKVIAKKNSSGQLVYIPSSNSSDNLRNLNYLMSGNKKKTIVIPKKSTIKLNGVLRPGNNTTLIATGAKIIGKAKSNVMFGAPDKKIKNLTLIGGTWRSPDKDGRTGSLFAFSYVDHLVMDGIDCNANYIGHAIEIIACTNVTIKNCTVNAIGKNPKNCLEEQIQIDIATKKTAPRIADFGSKYVQGQTCKNIYILNNKVKGARAVGVNYVASENGKWLNKYHENVVIKGNTLVGTTSEALAYFNVIGGEISNNKITTKATRTTGNSSYTIGIHIANFGKADKKILKSTLKITGNTVYGKRNGIHIKAYFNKDETKCLSQLGKVIISNNKVYCKDGKDKAIVQVKNSCSSYKETNNKTYVWK